MTTQQAALARLAHFLDASHVPYAIIGGLANIVWGEPRATLDIDVLLWLDEASLDAFVGRVAAAFTVLVQEPLPFIASTRVLPIETLEKVRVDLVFGLIPFEQEIVRRARTVGVEGMSVRFCSAEDLVLMKIVSDREKDLRDAETIVRRRLRELDLDYLEPRVRELALLLERPEIADRWARWKAEAGRRE